MDTETSPKGVFSVGGFHHPPPAYTSQIKPGRDRTRLFILGAIVMYVTILIGFFGLFFVLLSSPRQGGSAAYEGNDDTGSTIILEDVTFEVGDGVEHHESITKDGNMLKIQSVGDCFIAFFDYDRNILMVKNYTSGVCYFTSLDFVPDMGIDDVDQIRKFLFKEGQVNQDSHVEGYTFRKSSLIPPAYVDLTNQVVVASQCRGSLSYWIEPTDGNHERIVRKVLGVYEINLCQEAC